VADRNEPVEEDGLFAAPLRPRRRRSTSGRAGVTMAQIATAARAAFARVGPIAPRAGAVVVGVLLLGGLFRCMSGPGQEPRTTERDAPGVPRLGRDALATEPPVRYLELPNLEEPTP
jgi:hypothetical protein